MRGMYFFLCTDATSLKYICEIIYCGLYITFREYNWRWVKKCRIKGFLNILKMVIQTKDSKIKHIKFEHKRDSQRIA